MECSREDAAGCIRYAMWWSQVDLLNTNERQLIVVPMRMVLLPMRMQIVLGLYLLIVVV